MEKWTLPIILPCRDRNFQFYIRSASHYCVFLSFFQFPRNRYAEGQIFSYAMPIAGESNHFATGMLHPHQSATCVLYVTLLTLHCSIPPKRKEICPSLTGDVNPQSSHWNNGKMKIACNSAYVRTETLNFTSARQAVIVYFYICSYLPNAKYKCISWLFLIIISDCTQANNQMAV